MKCNSCKYLIKKDDISLLSQLMGYTAECSKSGVVFTIEHLSEPPEWCPLVNKDYSKIKEKP